MSLMPCKLIVLIITKYSKIVKNVFQKLDFPFKIVIKSRIEKCAFLSLRKKCKKPTHIYSSSGYIYSVIYIHQKKLIEGVWLHVQFLGGEGGFNKESYSSK